MPKKRNSYYYSQLAKQRCINHNTDISTQVSVDTNLDVDPTRVSVDTNSHTNTTPDVSSGIEIIVNELLIHKSYVYFVENSALLDVTNVASRSTSQRTNQPSDQPLAELAFQQGGQTTSEIDDAVQVKARHAIDKVQKELSEEAVRHITTAKMMYKPINDDITNIRSTGCKPKSWELNYPALVL